MRVVRKEGSGKKTNNFRDDDWHFFHASLPEGYENLAKDEVLKHLAINHHWWAGAHAINKPYKIQRDLLEEYKCDIVGLVNNVDSKPFFPVVSVISERLLDWAEANGEQDRLWDLPAIVFAWFFQGFA